MQITEKDSIPKRSNTEGIFSENFKELVENNKGKILCLDFKEETSRNKAKISLMFQGIKVFQRKLSLYLDLRIKKKVL